MTELKDDTIKILLADIKNNRSLGKTTYIGIAGAGRSGKDTLAAALAFIINASGFDAKIFALAQPLKDFVKDFVMDNYDIDVYKCSDDEKKLIRPLLVEAGRIKRIITKGQYFTSLLDERVKKLEKRPDVVIISDVRYAVYEETDELFWLQKKSGWLFFVERFHGGEVVPPANEDEYKNNIILREQSSVLVGWPTFNLDPQNIIPHAAQYIWPKIKL